MAESNIPETHPDEASGKGAVEDNTLPTDSPKGPEQTSLSGQLGHRDQDPLIKDNDTDFPEPDAEGEHTGEPEQR